MALVNTPEELEAKIDEYEAYCKSHKRKMTYAGFVLFCGYKNKNSFNLLKTKDPGFEDAISKFLLKLEDYAARNLIKKGEPIAGYIFTLKNNCGQNAVWKDKQEIEGKGMGPTLQVISSIDRKKSNFEKGRKAKKKDK